MLSQGQNDERKVKGIILETFENIGKFSSDTVFLFFFDGTLKRGDMRSYENVGFQ
jgi:hypothetical protein